MKMHPAYKQWVLALASVWLYAQQSFAGVQVSENFDTNWPGAPWAYNSFSNVANSVSGWSISSNSIASSQPTYVSTLSNSCFFARGGLATLTSPLLNGIGAVIYDAKVNSSYALINFESSYDGLTWSTNSTISNSVTSLTTYTNIINSYSNQYFRFRRIDTSGAVAFAIDTVRITYPTPRVAISNLTTIPSRPAEQDPVVISANVSIQSVPDTFAMTNYWREWPSTSWTNWIAMTSNSPNLYTATNIPGKAIGTIIEYYARATYTADGTTYSTNSNSTNTYVVIPKSSYTNLSVIGQLNSSLSNGASYLWQGVIQVVSNNPTFQFRGISNAFPTTWGDIYQSVTNIPLYGFAEVTNNTITLNTTNNGAYLFAFNETNLEYSVRSCTYENFNTWTNLNASTNTPSTNSTGWVLVSGNTSNDTSRLFSGTGRSAIMETNGWLQTPYLSNGVGQISLWYRNWSTTGAPTGKFTVQSGDSNATNWVTLGSVSNIISTNYLFFSVAANERDSKYVRIQNTNATTRLCLDEVVIAQPGAGVSGISTTPTSANILDPITISYTLTSYNGASISNVIAWYRVGTNGQWISGAMNTTDGIHYVQSTPITGLPPGTNALQYTAQCIYNGFLAINMQVFFAGGTNNPDSVTVNTPDDNRLEKFDTNWPGAPWTYTVYSNVANSVSGWSISSNSIASVGGYYSTPSNACFFAKGGQSALTSPHLTNGIGAIIYFARQSGPTPTILALESSYDGSSWFTNSIISNTVATLSSYTNIINSLSNQYFRLRRIDTGGPIFAIDDIRITYPPANVAITNVFINPGYPVAGQTFTGSCDVITLNPYFPAYNITPKFNYWLIGGSTSSITMSRDWVLGTTNHFSIPISLGSVFRDTPYGYNVSVTFDGYYGSAAEKKSPLTNSPSGSFTTRAYASEYGNIGILINGTTNSARMLTNGLWQSFVSFPTNVSSFNLSFQGSGYSTGSGYLNSTVQWGNTNNWKTDIPLNDLAGTNETAITNLTGSFSGDYLIRFNDQTREYLVQQCVYQDFESWNGAGAGTVYVRSDNVNFPLTTNNFDSWSVNTSQVRWEGFTNDLWTTFTQYTNAANGGVLNYPIFGAKINTTVPVSAQTLDSGSKGIRFIAQSAMWETPSKDPMRGIGTVKFDYRVASTNFPATFSLYASTDPSAGTNLMDYTAWGNWKTLTSASVIGATNTAFITKTIILKTNTTFDLIFSQDSGSTNAFFNNLIIDEWYADSQTNGGWITSEGYIEQRSAGNLWCIFDITRNDKTADQQYIITPVCSNGINSISFNYWGATTSPVSFNLDRRYGASSWTTLVSVTNNSTTNLFPYSYTVGTSTNNAQLRVRNTSPAPGILRVDDFKVSAKIAGLTWGINNASVDETDPATPPGTRQFYGAACYLNSNNIANINFGDPTNAPDTNATAYLLSPKLTFGVGEISFWYRNWATSSPRAATLYVQTSIKDLPIATNVADWNTVTVLSNIVNIADYQYLQLALYDRTSQWVRIYNDISTNVGRACLDDVLITAPMASSFAMSNLTVSPLIPLYTNTVDVMVDIYQLFLNPTNITLTALYGTSTNYAGLTNATLTSRPMTCIDTNPSAPGRWYRYKTSTPIPTNAIDTFVSYGAKATWEGLNAQVASPRTNLQFGTSPIWYNPLHLLYGTTQAYYIVYSCPTGAVWINEFNTDDPTLPVAQFIELCGPTGTKIENWKLLVFNDSVITTGQYTATSGAVLANPTNGFGFWVFGDSNVNPSVRSQLITNQIPNSGGFRLIRSCGVYEYAICFSPSIGNLSGLISAGFANTGVYDDTFWGDYSVSLYGTGSNYQNFAWLDSTYISSPGGINGGQTLVGISQNNIPPVVTIWSFRVNTNVWIECTKTSGWYNTPWYSTNLLYTNLWATMTPFTNIPNASNDVLSFTKPTNSPVYFYKVVSTNGL